MRFRSGWIALAACLAGCGRWIPHETEHLVLHVRPGSYAEASIREAAPQYELAYASIAREIPIRNPERIRCYLHDSPAFGAIGWERPSRREAHYVYSERIRLISAHEMAHTLLRDLNPNAPYRLEEGACRLHEVRTIVVGDRSESCPLPHLAKIAPKRLLRLREILRDTYRTDEEGNAAAAFVAFLRDRLGRERFWELYGRLDRGTCESAVAGSLGMPPDAVEAELARFVEALPDPPPLFGKRR